MKRRFNYKILLAGTNQVLKRAGLAWRTASLALAMMVTCAPTAHALPPGGGGSGDDPPDPIPEACDDVRGTLSVTPSFIDRNTSTSAVATLTWRVILPAGCWTPLGLNINSQPVGLSGSLSKEVTQTTTFRLRSQTWSRTFASATVTVSGDPGLITVSPGPTITDEDRAEFNARWMQPYQRNAAYSRMFWNLYGQNPRIAWEVSERMEAMARMYDLTQDSIYLNHLREFSDTVLHWRDDHHPGPFQCTPENPLDDPDDCRPTDQKPVAMPFDPFRGQAGIPAWGGSTVVTGGLHYVDEVSFGYAYPIAAFARIVAEHPNLQGLHGADAIRYTNDIIKTVQAFFPQILIRQRNNSTEATLKNLDILRSIPTPTQCNGNSDCLDLHKGAGIEMAHNWNQSYMMGLIELWKVLDNPWYRNHPNADPAAGFLHVQLPLLVSRLHRNFVNRLETIGSGETARFEWNYNDGLPPRFIEIGGIPTPIPNPDYIPTHKEDTSHGALDMRGLEVLRANFDRLNVTATAAGEPIVLNSTHLRRFANTFLQKIAEGSNFRKNVNGDEVNDGVPVDYYNFTCDGWANLAVADVRVYHKCYGVSLRVVNGGQPYLSIGNHSALFMNKRWLPPPPLRLVPDVRGLTLPEASGALVAAGFARGTVSYIADPTCDSIGLVISQNPAAGTSLAAGTLVKLSVAKTSSTACFD